MPVSNQHIIQKVNGRLTISGREKLHQHSGDFKQAVESSVTKLAKILDRVPGDRLLFIDSLSVDINMAEWNPGMLEEQINKALSGKLNVMIDSQEDSPNRENLGNISMMGMASGGQYREILRYFLKSGQIPWWATLQDMALAREQMDDFSASEWIKFMQPLIRTQTQVLHRFVNQWPKESVESAIQKIAKNYFRNDSLVILLKSLSDFTRQSKKKDVKTSDLWRELCSKIIQDLMNTKDELQIAKGLIQCWKNINGNNQHQTKKVFEELKNNLLAQLEFKPAVKEILEKISTDFRTDTVDENVSGDVANQSKNETFSPDKSVSVKFAGIVILHSYLPRLFSRLGYLEGGEFRNQSTRERAVCALHFLATGETEFPEEKLVLAKFLCNWPADKPINRFLDFSDYEKEECEKLLLSVISHWKALKNTSVSGLQKSFLQRDGILKKEAFGYTLYVEELTHDILLQLLPWSISIVKLTWMDEMLTVQWRF